MRARPDGTLLNYADGKTYPYLFWEGGSDALYQTPEKGFVTSRKDLSEFFDEKLLQTGLSAKESADFKEFWIPRMEAIDKPYDFRGLDQWENVSGFSLHTPERRGFTVVEWGGRLGKK